MTGLKLVIKLKKPPEQSPEPTLAFQPDLPKGDKKRKRSDPVATGNHFQYAQAGFASQPSPPPKKQNVGAKPFSVKLPSQAIATAVAGPSVFKPPKLTIKAPTKVHLGPPGNSHPATNPVPVPRVVIKNLPISDAARAIAQQVQQDVKHRERQDASKGPIANGAKVKIRTSLPSTGSVPSDEGAARKKTKLNVTPGKSSAQSLDGRSPSSGKKLKSIKLNLDDHASGAGEPAGYLSQPATVNLPQAKMEVSPPAAFKPERASKPRPPDRQELEHVVDKIQKKDTREIFRHPVTEDVAPGYFSVVSRPMDFTTIRQRLASGHYTSWELLEDDVYVMFDNAMAYNSPDTVFHKQARTLKDVAKKLVELGKEGVTNFRGRASGIVRAHNARIAAEERVEKEVQKTVVQQQKQTTRSSKMAHKAVMSGVKLMSLNFMTEDGAAMETAAEDGSLPKLQGGPRPVVRDNDGRRHLPLDENARNSFRPKAGSSTPLSVWGGLANGATAEGVQFAHGRPALRPVNMHMEASVESIARFTAGCSAAVQKLALARALDCVVVEGKKAPRPLPVQPAPMMVRPTDLIKPSEAGPLMDKQGMVQSAGTVSGQGSSNSHAQAALAQTLQMMAKMNANSSSGGMNVANMTGAQLAAALQSRTASTSASSFTPQQLLQQHQQAPTVPSHDQLVWQLAAHQQQQRQQPGVMVGGASGALQLQQHQHQRPNIPGSQPVLYHQSNASQPQLASILAAHQQQQMMQQVSQQQQQHQQQQQQQQQLYQNAQQHQQVLHQQQQQGLQVVYQPTGQQQLRQQVPGMYGNAGVQQAVNSQQQQQQQHLMQGASPAQLYQHQQASLGGQQHLASRMAAATPQPQSYLQQPNLMHAQQANLVQGQQQLPGSAAMHYSQGLAQLFQQGVMPSAGQGQQ